MLISIIIPNYNYAHLIVETLESVKAQTYTHFECIIVDDGSTDNSVEVITNWIKDDNRFMLLQKTNGGLPSTRNEGLKIAKGDWIALLDADDLWTSDKLQNQINVIEQNIVDVVYSDNLFFDDSFENKGEVRVGNPSLDLYDFLGGNPIPGCCSSIMIHQRVIADVGFFNNDCRSAEDLEYLFRIALKGYRFIGTGKLDIKIRRHAVSMQTNLNRVIIHLLYCFDISYARLIQSGQTINQEKFKEALFKWFKTIIWKSRDANRPDLTKLIYVKLYHLLGWKFYFSKLFMKNFIYDTKVALSTWKR